MKKHLQTNYKIVHSKACIAKHIREGCPGTRKKKCPTCFRLLLLQTIKRLLKKGCYFKELKIKVLDEDKFEEREREQDGKKRLIENGYLECKVVAKMKSIILLDEEHRKVNSHLCPEEENHANGFFENG